MTVTLDGVDYLAGSREELLHAEPSDVGPSAEAAEEVLGRLLAALEGRQQRLRAGWAAVRWAVGEAGGGRWEGPAYLFALEARVAGTFEVVFSGEDDAEWPPPELSG